MTATSRRTSPRPSSRRARPAALALVLASLALMVAVPVPAVAASKASSCSGADANPSSVSRAAARKTTLCLLNAERRPRGLGQLRHNRRLALAATRHARDMVNRDYFAHDSESGASFVDRIMKTGYVARSASWLLGENLAWGSGELATPRSIVQAWMDSPGHRANILNRGFREIGIAVVLDAPVRDQHEAATYATDFGTRG